MATEAECSATEEPARQAWNCGDMATTVTIVYEGYGTEIYSFLLAQFHSHAPSADDVFSQFGEDFWRSLPQFSWKCSIRAWCYKLARSAASRYRRTPYNQRGRRVAGSAGPWFEAVAQSARTSTRPHLRSEVKDEFQRLRDKLSAEDRDLLILRVDRQLSWKDVANAMLTLDQTADDDAVRKKEVALRQRYSEIKKRLKALAIEAGLLESDRA